MSRNLEVALDFCRRGFSVIPVRPQSKEALVPWGHHQYWPAGQKAIRRYWSRNENLNVGVLAGAGATPEHRNMFILDYDDAELLAAHRGKLPRRTIEIQTGRIGGLHIWLIAPAPVMSRRHCKGLDIRGFGSYGLVPPSEHPDGPTYEYAAERTEIARVTWRDLAFLGIQPASKTLQNERPEWIPPEAWAVLRGQHYVLERGYHTRSEYEQFVICSLIGDGCDAATVHQAFERFAHSGSKYRELVRERGQGSARIWLDRSIRTAQSFFQRRYFAVKKSTDSILATVAKVRCDRCEDMPRRSVLAVLVDEARRRRRLDVNLSVREISERSQLALATVHDRLQLLEAEGFFLRQPGRRKYDACRFSLPEDSPGTGPGPESNIQQVPVSVLSTTGVECDGCSAMSPVDPGRLIDLQRHELFSRPGLGKDGLKLYLVMLAAREAEFRWQNLFAVAGLTRASLRRKLRAMAAAGLVVRTGGRWALQLHASLDEAAERLGVNGVADTRILRHTGDRVRFDRINGRNRIDEHRRRVLAAPDAAELQAGRAG